MSGFQSLGDLSTSFRLRALNAGLKSDAARHAEELATGRTSDMAKHVNGGLDRIAAMERSVRVLDMYETAAGTLGARGAALQVALNRVASQTVETGTILITAAGTLTQTSLAAGSDRASVAFETTVAALNADFAGQALFAGKATKSAALPTASDILDALETLSIGATNAADIFAAVDLYFDGPTSTFETTTYLGDPEPLAAVHIGEGETASFQVTALDPDLRETLKNMSAAALISRGALGNDLSEQSTLLRTAGENLLTAHEAVVDLQGRIGAVEERIETTRASNSARQSAVRIELNSVLSVDTFKTATDLQAVETRLEALYISTSRLSQLSLTRYLR